MTQFTAGVFAGMLLAGCYLFLDNYLEKRNKMEKDEIEREMLKIARRMTDMRSEALVPFNTYAVTYFAKGDFARDSTQLADLVLLYDLVR